MTSNRSNKTNYFFANPTRKEVFNKKTRKKTTRKETRKRLKELKLAVTLSKVINHFFQGLLPALARVNDPRNASYITYSGKVILMTRILSSVFYISSMRKSSEEFNSDKVIQNIVYLCNEELEELLEATKNHYYLIQIGHMVAQIIEGWKKIWEGIEQSREQKHRRMLENFKMVDLKEYKEEIQEQCQIRF